MPLLGLGLYRADDARLAVSNAASMGYRLFDTASSYRNEEEVGLGLKDSGLSREDVFVTTKLWNTAQRLGNIEGAFTRSLERLGLSYVDLYLVHWPVPGLILDTWHILEDIYRSGRAREPQQRRPRRKSDRVSPAFPAPLSSLVLSGERHCRAGVVPAGPRRVSRPGNAGQARGEISSFAGSDRASLARPAGHQRDSEEHQPRPPAGKYPDLRFYADRSGDGDDRDSERAFLRTEPAGGSPCIRIRGMLRSLG